MASSIGPAAELRLPIYLDPDVQRYLEELASDKGVPQGEMVNGLIEHEIEMIESGGSLESPFL